ncbi:serine/threonine-protein kinase [Bacteroides sp. 224]|uniref:serine/threonine protein kinase n=1 Tax=Bacteroides sp. 224 TaxID=2302936 RepID=UPI0013D152CC|nr:serine/threonine-protein kinase [Bacteroides sp. 224]NDV66405.1 serine/threonine protein kinase [Bacteroides sp. 224]
MSSLSLLIGEGATSFCYKVNRDGKWLLMKQLKQEFTTDPLYLEALKKEFEVGQHLDHPNIVRYVNGTDTEIFMQYVDGLPLNQFIKMKPNYFKDKANRKRFVDELTSAIDYLHLHQVLHLDLKPTNILITRQGNHVKLIDFGFAYQDCFIYQPAGTEGYTAPEQINGSADLSPASDIYAIGRVLKELNIGSRKVINKCMADDPKRRYQSVEELRAALQSASGRWRYWVVACGVGVVLVGALSFDRQDGAKLSEYNRYEEKMRYFFAPVDSLLSDSLKVGDEFAAAFKEVFDECYRAAKEDELCGKYIETKDNDFANYTQDVFGFFVDRAATEHDGSSVDVSGK